MIKGGNGQIHYVFRSFKPLGGQEDVLEHSQVWKEVGNLKCPRYPEGNSFVGGDPGHILSEMDDPPP